MANVPVVPNFAVVAVDARGESEMDLRRRRVLRVSGLGSLCVQFAVG